ncbi:MAG: RidA family protein [Chloroflexi bacterium]|nr:RidA family protein [Chloroflexota bacterium]
MEKRIVTRKDAPKSDSPYSPAVVCGSLVFVSGQVPIDPSTGAFRSGTLAEQANLTLENLRAVLEEAGSSMDKVLKTTVFLADMADFAAFNEIYKRYFPKDRPARSCIGVKELPFGARVEIEAIACL